MRKIEIENKLNKDKDLFYFREKSSDLKGVREIYKDNIYQKKKINLFIEKGDKWLDLGGNIGGFSVFASAIADKVYCYEAESQNVKMIKNNLKLNSRENVEVVEAAVVHDSFKGKSIELYVNENPNHFWMHSIFKAKPNSKKKLVKAVRFSDALEQTAADCVKMDIEGAEVAILYEHKDFSNLKKLVFEWSFDKEPRIAVLRELLKKLEGQFKRVYTPKLPDQDLWNFYPPAQNVWCSNV